MCLPYLKKECFRSGHCINFRENSFTCLNESEANRFCGIRKN